GITWTTSGARKPGRCVQYQPVAPGRSPGFSAPFAVSRAKRVSCTSVVAVSVIVFVVLSGRTARGQGRYPLAAFGQAGVGPVRTQLNAMLSLRLDAHLLRELDHLGILRLGNLRDGLDANVGEDRAGLVSTRLVLDAHQQVTDGVSGHLVSAFVLVTVLGIIAEVIGLVAEIVITEVITEVVVLVVLRSLLGGGLLRGLLVGLDLGLGAALALRLGLLLDILVVRLGSRLRGDIGDGAALHESGGQLVHRGGQFFDLLFQRHQGFSRSLRRMVGGSSALAFSGRVGSTGGC